MQGGKWYKMGQERNQEVRLSWTSSTSQILGSQDCLKLLKTLKSFCLYGICLLTFPNLEIKTKKLKNYSLIHIKTVMKAYHMLTLLHFYGEKKLYFSKTKLVRTAYSKMYDLGTTYLTFCVFVSSSVSSSQDYCEESMR